MTLSKSIDHASHNGPQDGVYWDGFYNSATAGQLGTPSQFALFALSETENIPVVFDIGCGSGRDAFFLAAQGKKVLGVDSSSKAIDLCRKRAATNGYSNIEFLCADVRDAALPRKLGAFGGPERVLIYARFFLHAIDDEAQNRFLKLAGDLCKRGSMLAVEFRTTRDSAQTKVTPDHYRRFINPVDLLSAAHNKGLKLAYFVEGFGYAKYKQDDAHVARCLFSRA